MEIKRVTSIMIFVLIIIICSGCQPVSTDPPPLTYETTDGISVGANLNCPDRAAFGYIDENVPSGGASVSSPVVFRWYYFSAAGAAPDWSNDCVPHSFTLYLSPGPDFSTSTAYPVTPTSVDNMVNLLMYTTIFDEPLDPICYRWMVVGHAEGINIDDDQLSLFQDETAWHIVNNQAQMMGQFSAGTGCGPQEIGPPDLIYPPNQAALENDTPNFQWDVPGGPVQAHWLTFSTDPQMSTVDFGWVTPDEDFQIYSGHLQPCITYYWQVHAGEHALNYHQQMGDWATVSETRSFIIPSPSCPDAQADPPGTSSESTPTPVADDTPTPVPPTGVVNTPTYTPHPPTPTFTPTPTPVDRGSIKVHIWKDSFPFGEQTKGEPHYSGLTVYLKRGTCGGIGIGLPRTATTDSNGNVTFSNLIYSSYCVSTDIGANCSHDGHWDVHPPGYPADVEVNSTTQRYIGIGFRVCIK